MKLYRIHTEYKENLAEIVVDYFEGFTITQGIGYYNGVPEKCAIIEIVDNDKAKMYIDMLGQAICYKNNQAEVLSYAIEL